MKVFPHSCSRPGALTILKNCLWDKHCLATELNGSVMTAQDSILMRDAATGNVETIKDHGKKDLGSFSRDEW